MVIPARTHASIKMTVVAPSGVAPLNGIALVSEKTEIGKIPGQFLGCTLAFVQGNNFIVDCLNFSDNELRVDKNVELTSACPVFETEKETTELAQAFIGAVTCSEGLSNTEIREAYRDLVVSQQRREKDGTCIVNEPQELERLLDFLVEHRNAVALESDAIEATPLCSFSIKLKEGAPTSVFMKQYRLPRKYVEKVDAWVQDCRDKGYVEPSTSSSS